jgi:hypothetical protein
MTILNLILAIAFKLRQELFKANSEFTEFFSPDSNASPLESLERGTLRAILVKHGTFNTIRISNAIIILLFHIS